MDRVDHFGRDLFVALDDEPTAGRCASSWRSSCATACAQGRLHAGTALPATRALAAELGVARGVVVEAYGNSSPRATSSRAVGRPHPWRGRAAAAAPPRPRRARAMRPVRMDLRPESRRARRIPPGSWLAACAARYDRAQ